MEQEGQKEVAVAVEKRAALGKNCKKHGFRMRLYEQETQKNWGQNA